MNNPGHTEDCDMNVQLRVSGVRCIFVYRFLMDLAGMLDCPGATAAAH